MDTGLPAGPQEPPPFDLDAFAAAHEARDQLRLLTCGSVDDGKSTLLGRLLWETQAVADDQMTALAAASRRHGTQGAAMDLALLVDGLAAEREQGITIDVAYRFFSTDRRKFIVADTPGHEQYTRNMVTGASTADLAVILVDARRGILTQTRRHSFLVHLVGIRSIVLAVNKMDLVGWSESVFDTVVAEYAEFARALGIERFTAIPLSGLGGDNVAAPSAKAPWYRGATLMEHLERVSVDRSHDEDRFFRMPVQWVNRPNPEFRGYAGMVAEGHVKAGDELRVLPGGRTSRVARVLVGASEVSGARAGQSVTLVLDDEIDISRGDVLARSDAPVPVADQFCATLVWMGDDALLPGRSYWLKLGTRTLAAQVTAIKHKIDVNTLAHVSARTLECNEIAVANISVAAPLPFEPYAESRALGGFILVDRLTNATVGAGFVQFALRRSDNIHWQALDVTRESRAAAKNQLPAVLWFTGLSGSGKSTIANLLDKKLNALGRHTIILDGDNVRHGLNRDLGFTDADRVENIRRVAEVARLMADAGLIVLVSFISPFRAERDLARSLLPPGEFFEVHVATPLAVAEARDPKGLYRKARAGELANFTGVDSAYEEPLAPAIVLDTVNLSAEHNVDRLLAMLEAAHRLEPASPTAAS